MAKAKSSVSGVAMRRTMSGKDVLYKVMTLKLDYGINYEALKMDAEFIALQSIMRLNDEQDMTHDGLKYVVAGPDAGRDNPSKGLEVLIASVKGELISPTGRIVKAPAGWENLKWITPEDATQCPVCNAPVGRGVKILKDDGTIGTSPSLSLSHMIPSIMFGATHDGNVYVECRKCNARRGDRMPKMVRAWYESLKFTVYKVK